MPSELTCRRVFIASRSWPRRGAQSVSRRDRGIQRGRRNTTECPIPAGPAGRTHSATFVPCPQTIINEDVRRADYFVLVLEPLGVAAGHHLLALHFRDRGRVPRCPGILPRRAKHNAPDRHHVQVSRSPAVQRSEAPQLQKVLEFRNDIEQQKTHLFHSFDTTESFRKLIRRHLAAWLRDEENGGVVQKPVPSVVEPVIEDSADTRKQQQLEPFESSLTAKAWALADEGRLTEAEVEFARNVVGRQQPQPLQYGRFLFRLGRLDQATVMFEGAVTVAKDQEIKGLWPKPTGASASCSEFGVIWTGAERMHRQSLEINERLGRLWHGQPVREPGPRAQTSR